MRIRKGMCPDSDNALSTFKAGHSRDEKLAFHYKKPALTNKMCTFKNFNTSHKDSYVQILQNFQTIKVPVDFDLKRCNFYKFVNK